MSHVPFSVLFQINYASLWHHRFEQDKKKRTNNRKKTTFCCILAAEANSSKCSLIHYSQKKKALALKSHSCRWNSQISSNQAGPDVAHAIPSSGQPETRTVRRQAFYTASPDDTANVVCLSLARRQTAAWAGCWPTGTVQAAPTEAQLAECSLDRYRKNPAVLIYL